MDVGESSHWLWVPLAFGALWVVILQVAARWGGWRVLAEAYPSHGTPTGQRFRMRSARFRAGCNYNRCITFACGPDGLHLSLPFLLAFGHPPLSLPWSELRAHEDTVWRIPVVVLTTARHPRIPIKLGRDLAERLLAGSGSHRID